MLMRASCSTAWLCTCQHEEAGCAAPKQVLIPVHLACLRAGEAQVNCDGEPLRDTHFSFGIVPQRLRLHVPHPQLLSQPRPERQRLSQLWEQQVRLESTLLRDIALSARAPSMYAL